MQPALTFRDATPADLPAIEQLLRESSLPLEGVAEHLTGFHGAWSGDTLVAVAALERHGRDALLRSVAVRADARGTGLGRALTTRLLDRAAAEGLHTVSLLTTTAEPYFLRFGFRRVTREALPVSLAASKEFQGACPDTAAALRLELLDT